MDKIQRWYALNMRFNSAFFLLVENASAEYCGILHLECEARAVLARAAVPRPAAAVARLRVSEMAVTRGTLPSCQS